MFYADKISRVVVVGRELHCPGRRVRVALTLSDPILLGLTRTRDRVFRVGQEVASGVYGKDAMRQCG
jgi:hypothetical protein